MSTWMSGNSFYAASYSPAGFLPEQPFTRSEWYTFNYYLVYFYVIIYSHIVTSLSILTVFSILEYLLCSICKVPHLRRTHRDVSREHARTYFNMIAARMVEWGSVLLIFMALGEKYGEILWYSRKRLYFCARLSTLSRH